MSKMRRFLTAAAFAACAILPTAMAQTAPKVLVLATEETDDYYTSSLNNLRTALANYATVTSANGDAKVLTTGDITGMDFSQYQIVVVAVGQYPISQKNLDTLETQIRTNKDLAFIILADGCTSCVNGNNDALGKFIDIVNEASGENISYIANRFAYTQTNPAKRNDASMYSGNFSVDSIMAEYYGAILYANNHNRIYGTDVDPAGALAVFMPQKQMNGGACTFLSGDLSIFKNGFGPNAQPQPFTQHNDVAKTLLDAMQPGSAACDADSPPSGPKVLYLSTAEKEEGNMTNGVSFIQNAREAFRNQAVYFFDRSGVLSTDTQRPNSDNLFASTRDKWGGVGEWETAGKAQAELDFSNLGKGDVVVVQTAYRLMDTDKANFITEQILNRKDLTFILMLDTCNACSAGAGDQNANLMAIAEPTINEALGWGIKSERLSSSLQWTSNLNAHRRSEYAGGITLTELHGHTSGVLQCVPQQNVLYPAPTPREGTDAYQSYTRLNENYQSGWFCDSASAYLDPNCAFGTSQTVPTANWPELNASSSFGFIVPFWQSKGACIYLGQDNNLFDDRRSGNTSPPSVDQRSDLVSMFLSLPEGACTKTLSVASSGSTCTNPDQGCTLAAAPEKTPDVEQKDYDATLAVLATTGANGEPTCEAKVWCDSKQENRADTDTCAAGENHTTHCCRDACTEGEELTTGCFCKAPMVEQNGKCVTPPTPVPVCTDGQAIASPCTCQAPMVDDGGICIANSPICQPPHGCSSAPAAGWPALLGLGGVLPLLAAARRRRRK